MSKRLNKRQMREMEELEALRAAEKSASGTPAAVSDDDDEDAEEDAPAAAGASGAFNPFAALEGGDEHEEEDEEEEDAPVVAKKKKNKKKKPKKKTAAAGVAEDESAASTPKSKKGKGKKGTEAPAADLDGMDEVDRALAELRLKYGDMPEPEPEAGPSQPSESRSVLVFRNLLSVDPKNLDADAELRRFFGSKVIGAASTASRRSAKMRYTLSKPKPNYPPPVSLAGLSMHEMAEIDVLDLYDRRGWEHLDKGEKWFTFKHSPAWREIERQFIGAVRSHDPNQLMALLQVYPWHVDTLLQMSEVYRLQSDIGEASDFAERALYAFDRCLVPGFNVTSGACRLDFDYVENRPMFTALHRIISYLGRRGCWVTAFNFAKLLFALDPEGDPHGAAFWLDFLAIKTGNGAWLLSMLDQREYNRAAAFLHGYPGMAYARALALREGEDGEEKGTAALIEAMKAFPEVILLLADKVGASVPDSARGNKLLQTEAGYTKSPTIALDLLAHIYVARNEALWKTPSNLAWLQKTIATALPDLNDATAVSLRVDAHAIIQTPRDLGDDGTLLVPLNICRHVLCSESTSWLGFLPPHIAKLPFHAYDPLPPPTSMTQYDAQYFDPVARARGAGFRGPVTDGDRAQMFAEFLRRVRDIVGRDPEDWAPNMREVFRDFVGVNAQDLPVDRRAEQVRQLVHAWEGIVANMEADFGRGGGMPDGPLGDMGDDAMPGAFPE